MMNTLTQKVPLRIVNYLPILFFFGIHPLLAQNQIEVAGGNVPPYDPITLIEDVLLGEGVEILNIEYEGDNAAVGYFNKGTNAIGLEEGIVLTTGVAATEGANIGIVNPGSVEVSANNSSTATDPDVDFYAENAETFNVAKYVITFVPSSDQLSFRYVFASDEYPEFGCTQYNDFFGFFISGPGFSGTFENGSENIALIPGTNLPVTINNIHPPNPIEPSCGAEFIEFFNDNDGSSDFPVYDGYLDIFTAQATVVPCETYTIKLVIADIRDSQRDSGVFFEARSFNSNGFQVSTSTQSFDGTIVEECTEGSFVITIDEPAASDIVIDYEMVGDALNGVDYELIAGDIIIPAGSTTVSVPVVPITDTEVEEVESVGFDIQINNCTRDTIYLYLRDGELESPDLGDDQVLCSGESTALDGTVNVTETETLTFTSTASETIILGPIGSNPPTPAFMDIEVSGFNPPELAQGIIESVCMNINHSAVADLDIYLYAPGGQFILLTSDNGDDGDNYTQTCFTPNATQDITFGQAEAPASAAPFTGDFLPEGAWENLWFGDSPVNGTWRLMAIDDESGFTGAIQDWSITFNDPYSVEYSWSPTAGLSCSDCPNPTATPAATETYTLTVTDTYGCEVSDEITLTVINNYEAPMVDCSDLSTESITFIWNEVDNATGYEVNVDNSGWVVPNDGLTSHIVSGLSTGTTVSIQVRATGDCPADIATQSCVTIDCPTLNINASALPTSCVGASDGSIMVTASGGNAGTTYTLNGESNTTGMFENLSADTYEIMISDDLGCSEMFSIPVPDAAAITSSVMLINNIDCDNTTGSASVSANGGTDNFVYVWSNGDTGNTLTANTVGEYFVTITDGNMCTSLDSVEIITEGSLEASISGNTICAGSTDGEASITITAGAEPITYQWSANAQGQEAATITGLSPDDYTVTVTSADGCEQFLGITIEAFPEMTLMTSSTDANCGATDGTVSVEVMGGTADFTYLWSDDMAQNTPTATNLGAGEYFVTVTDANMCEQVANVFVNTPSSIVQDNLSTTPTSCFGGADGSVSFTASGGTPPLTYTLGSSPLQTTGNFTNLSAGDYDIIVTDGMGCSTTFPFSITQPDEIETQEIVINNIDCSTPTGSATLSVTDALGDYTFMWSNMQTDSILTTTEPGEFFVTVTSAVGCVTLDTVEINQAEILSVNTGSTGACIGESTGLAFVEIVTGTAPITILWDANAGGVSTDTAFNLAPGQYEVTISDSGNCEEILSIMVDEFAPMTLSTSTTDADCNGTPDGTATVDVMGGTADFTYLWNDVNAQTSATATGLAAGLYEVTVSDENGCSAVATATVSTPSQLAIDAITATPATCFNGNDGTTTVTVSGGTGDFTYEWSDPNAQTMATATGLSPDSYFVTVTDEEGCLVTSSVEVENAAEIQLSFTTNDVLCADDNDGSIDLSVVGAVGTATFNWDNGANSEDLSGLSAGTFNVTVTDANMCEATGSTVINTTAPIELITEIENVSCFDFTDGAISTSISGGAEPYTYAWSNGATTSDLTDLPAGIYDVTVTDNNNCGIFESLEITQPDFFSAEIATVEPLCAESADGSLAITTTGGSPDFTYSLNGGNFSPISTFENLTSQNYTIQIQDANDCIFSEEIFLAAPPVLEVNAGEDQTVEVGDRAFINAIALGGTGDISVSWETPEDIELSCLDCLDPYALADRSNVLIITAIDENDCVDTDNLTIFVNKNYKLYVPNIFSPDLDGVNDLFAPQGKANTFIEKMRVFDRWGDLVHESQEFFTVDQIGWDGTFNGKDVEIGVYVYVIEALFPDGETVIFKGDVTVVR